MNKRRNREDS